MTIFTNNLIRLYRDKFTLIVLIILPVIFIAFSMFALGSDAPLNVAIIDNDNTQLTSMLKDGLKSSSNMMDLKEQDIKQKLISGKLDYAIKIDKGFTSDLIKGKDVKLETFSLKETNTSGSVKFFAESFVNSSKNIALTSKGNETEFYRGMEIYARDIVSANYLNVENTERDKKGNTYVGLGFLIMFMLFMSINAASLILEDKQLKTYSRVLSSPITTRRYFIQNIISFIAIMFFQVLAIFAILIFVFKADMGPSIGNLLVLFAVFALTAVAMGVAVSSFAKDLRQANALSNLISIPMCMLGGCFWPRDIMPGILQQLSNFTPVTWVLKATEKVLYGGSISAISSELAILLLFALVFLIMGSNRKVMMKG